MINKKLHRAIIYMCFSFFLSACSILGYSGAEAQHQYDELQRLADENATKGAYSWSESARRLREADKMMASSSDYPTWRYDSNDEEYHSFCVAMAERLDKRLISFAEYDAARIAKFNAIRARARSLNLQAQQVRNAQSSNAVQPVTVQAMPLITSTCLFDREIQVSNGRHCVYICNGTQVINSIGIAGFCPHSIER